MKKYGQSRSLFLLLSQNFASKNLIKSNFNLQVFDDLRGVIKGKIGSKRQGSRRAEF